jgi:alpha-ketoglutarate-dependent taurine dioxygenase
MATPTLTPTVEPLNPEVGALISGVDLRAILPPDAVRHIRRAVLDHGAVIFRGQDLTKEEMQVFMENFGTIAIDPISPVPEQPVAAIDAIYESETSMSRYATSVWHIDS